MRKHAMTRRETEREGARQQEESVVLALLGAVIGFLVALFVLFLQNVAFPALDRWLS